MKHSFRHIGIAVLLFLAGVPSAHADNVSSFVVVAASIPGDPSNLIVSSVSPSQAVLAWTDNSSNEEAFSIERKTGTGGAYAEIATSSVNVASHTDNSVSANTTYYYRVRAYNSDGASGYTNELAVTTPTTGSNGGGGGGGGGGYPIYATKALFRGTAYPRSDVTLLRDAQIVATTKAGDDAKFEIAVDNLVAGTYVFGVWAEDVNGNRSITHTFTIALASGATTVVGGIFIPPFFSLDKSEVKRGDVLTFYGTTAPQAAVSVLINSETEIVKNATASVDGSWVYKFDTNEIEYGAHTAKTRAAKDGDITDFSRIRSFTVGTKNVTAPPAQKCPLRGDFNKDCKTNLIDFSMMAYWFKRTLTPVAVATYDLNGDKKISLIDFSILVYYWTG
jgi:hypothetical protein